MKYLEVVSFTPPAGLEYVVKSYPHDGLFLNDNGNVVSVGGNMVFIISNLDRGWIEESTQTESAQMSGGVSESTFLKALLIMREPHLVNKLDL